MFHTIFPRTTDIHLLDRGQANTYISPSDTIMSPTTKKLSDLKGKRFANGKPQSLFAKAVGNNTKTPSPEKVGGFEDVNKTSPS